MKRRNFFAALAAPFAAKAHGYVPGPPPRRFGRLPASVLSSLRALQQWGATQPDGPLLSAHQWNYGWREITGETCPAPHEFGLGDGMARISADHYLRVRSAV